MPRLCLACAVAAVLLTAVALLAPPAASAAGPVSFIGDIAPVLQERCFACHNERKKSGKYDMTRFDRLAAGGRGGEPVAAGRPDESELYALMVTAEDRRMPPRDKGDAVPGPQAELVRRWIAEGAKLDAGLDPAADLVSELRARWQPPAPAQVVTRPAPVAALAFTPDGRRLVAGGRHELTVWEVPAGRLVARVRTRMERAYAMQFLADGTLAVAGGRPGQEGDVTVYHVAAPGDRVEDGVARLDGVTDDKVRLARLAVADDAVLCLAATPDGKRLAAGGCDRLARVWDVAGGAAAAKLVATADTHSDWVLGVALSADGGRLATAGRDKTAKLFDIAAQEALVTFPDHRAAVNAVAFSPDGKLVYSAGLDREVRGWEAGGDGKQKRGGHGHRDDVLRLAAHPGAKLLATAAADGAVIVWDAEPLNRRRVLEGPGDQACAVAFSPDGKLVAGGAYTGAVRVWGVADGKEVVTFVAAAGR